MASGDGRCWLRKICIHLTPRTILIFLHALGNLQWIQNLPLDHARHSTSDQMSICLGVSVKHHHLFTIFGRTYIEHNCLELLLQQRAGIMLNLKKCKFLTDKNGLFGTYDMPQSIGSSFSYHGRSLRLKILTCSREIEVIFGIMPGITTFRSSFSQDAAPLSVQWKDGG